MIINTLRSGHTCQSVQRDGWCPCPSTLTHNFTSSAFRDEESPDSWQRQVFYLLRVRRGKCGFSPLLLLNVLLGVCGSVWAGCVTWLSLKFSSTQSQTEISIFLSSSKTRWQTKASSAMMSITTASPTESSTKEGRTTTQLIKDHSIRLRLCLFDNSSYWWYWQFF